MAAKQMKFKDEAQMALLAGINKLTDAVATTLGPRGRNVAIDKKWGSPTVLHDGVSVAKEIELKDPYENMGAQLLKGAALKTADVAGDGTTTATILAQAVVTAGLKSMSAGANPMMIRTGLQKGTNLVVEELMRMKKDVSGNAIEQVATISAGDSVIGKLIAEAINKVGKDGVITVEESKGLELTLDYKEGMEFDKGYVSPYFVTDSARMESTITDAYILITDKKISSMSDLLPFLEKFVKISKNLVIIADDVDGEALATLVVNKIRGTFNALVVKAPGFGDRRKAMLADLAVLTGATVITEELGRKLENADIEDLGQADRVTSDKDSTVIVGGKGTQSDIQARVAQIKNELEVNTSDFDKEKLQERLAKLTGGVAVIQVGAPTEVALKEKKERVIDAVSATKAAVEEGIVPGGEVSLLRASLALDNVKGATEDEQIGYNILKEALKQPFIRLLQNAGEDAGWALREIMKNKDTNFGYNVVSQKFVDLVADGVVDPVKVTRSALQNAVSVAELILTTEVLITEMPEDKPAMPMGGAPGMGGMGGMDY
ncbi:MAG: chaperonin GroEL [bacterium]|nr:chaperonin GroEL [bacterium]